LLARIATVSIGLVFLLVAVARAQTTPATGEKPASPVEQAALETFYLPDKDTGKLIPIFRALTFDEFEKLYKLHNQLAAPDPGQRYSIQSMAIRGSVRGDSATLNATLRIKTVKPGWSKVDLRFDSVLLTREAVYRGPGKAIVDFSPEDKHYYCLVSGEADSVHTIEMQFVTPLSELGGERRLQLQTPPAVTSTLQLTIPAQGVDVTAVKGGVFRSALPQSKQTRLDFLGLRGEFQMTWRPQQKETNNKTRTVLEASALLRVTFDGRFHTRSDATLKIDSLSGDISSFLVRLPTGMRLVPQDESFAEQRYTVIELSDQEKLARKLPARLRDAPLAEVTLVRKTSDRVEVNLRTVRRRDVGEQPGATASGVDAAGFEVIGASNQWGYIELAVQGDWNVEWKPEGVTQIGDLTAAMRQNNVVARFEYQQQPCQLLVTVTPRPERVRAEPTYLLKVDAVEAQLEARIRYQVRGASQLKINMPGWTIDSIQPENIFEQSLTGLEGVEPLTLTLAPRVAQSSTAFDVVIKARHATGIMAEPTRTRLALPLPQTTTTSPATLTVVAADEIKLDFDASNSAGLQLRGTPRDAVSASPGAVYFQLRSGLAPIFSSVARKRSRRITAGSGTTAALGAETAQINQTLAFNVEFEPVDSIFMWLPEEALAGVVKLNGAELPKESIQPVPDSTAPDSTAPDSTAPTPPGDAPAGAAPETEPVDADVARALAEPEPSGSGGLYQISTGRSMLGEFSLALNYTVALPTADDRAETTLALPLAAAVVDRVSSNTLDISAGPWDVKPGDSSWKPAPAGMAKPGKESSLTATGVLAEAVLKVMRTTVADTEATTVEKAWLQTSYAADQRRDRAVFVVNTSSSRIEIALPPNADASGALVSAAGNRQATAITGDRLLITIPPTAGPHVIEVWYMIDQPVAANGWRTITRPQIVGATPPREFYYQAVLPAQQQILSNPAGMNPEQLWSWNPFSKEPAAMTQRQLEEWTGSSEQTPPAATSRQFLYSSFVPVNEISFMVGHSLMLMIAASVIAMLCGGLLLYRPEARQPYIWMAGAAVLLAAGVFYPHLALQVAQAAGLGIVLTALMVLLKLIVSRPGVQRVAAPAPVSGPSVFTPEGTSMPSTSLREASSLAPTASGEERSHEDASGSTVFTDRQLSAGQEE